MQHRPLRRWNYQGGGGNRVFKLHELLRAFGAHHGQMLNYSAVCRTLCSSRLQVGRRLNELCHCGYLRLLPSLPDPRPPDIIKRPCLYLRQRAWKHAFAPTPSARGCLRVPVQGQLASRITDAVIERETSARRPSAFYAMGRYRARGIDLVVRRSSGWRIGFCFEPSRRGSHVEPAYTALLQALAEGWIDAAILVCCEGEPAIRRRRLLCLPPSVLLSMYHQWTSQATSGQQLEEMLRWLNGQIALFLGTFCGPEEPQSLDWQFEGLPEEPDDPFLPRPP